MQVTPESGELPVDVIGAAELVAAFDNEEEGLERPLIFDELVFGQLNRTWELPTWEPEAGMSPAPSLTV